VEHCRAKVKGCAWYTDAVNANPRCSVTDAIAGMSNIGSFAGTCMPSRIEVSPLPRKVSYRPITSARNRVSNPPRSRSRARSSHGASPAYSS